MVYLSAVLPPLSNSLSTVPYRSSDFLRVILCLLVHKAPTDCRGLMLTLSGVVSAQLLCGVCVKTEQVTNVLVQVAKLVVVLTWLY